MSTLLPTAPESLELPPPEAPRERVPAYVWLFLASLALNVFSGHWSLMHVPLPLDRLLLLGSLFLLVLEPRRDGARWPQVYTVMVVLVLWTTWSAITAETLTTSEGFYALLDRIVVPFVMFAVGPMVFSTTHRRDLLLRVLTLTGLYLGVVAIASMAGPHALALPRYVTDFMATDQTAIDDPRAYGPFLSAEGNGMALSLCAFAAVLLWVRTRHLGWRLLCLVTVPVALVGLVLTLTRSIWMGALVGAVLVALIVPAARRWALGGAVAAFVLGAAAWVAIPELSHLVTGRLTTSRSLYDRANTYEAGWRVLNEHPLFGMGWSTFINHGTEWVRQSPDYPVTTVTIEIHNVFLSRAVETGVIGAALWVVVVCMSLLAVLWRERTITGERGLWWLYLLFALCVWIVPTMTSPNPYPFPNYLVWLVAGIVGREALVRNRTTRRDAQGIERRTVQED